MKKIKALQNYTDAVLKKDIVKGEEYIVDNKRAEEIVKVIYKGNPLAEVIEDIKEEVKEVTKESSKEDKPKTATKKESSKEIMKFKINNCEWEIIELTNDQMIEIAKKYREVKEYEYYRGYTSYVENKIYLNTINVIDMKHVLYHELVHAYLYSFGLYDFDSYGEEDVCNIEQKFFIINEIIEKYFK